MSDLSGLSTADVLEVCYCSLRVLLVTLLSPYFLRLCSDHTIFSFGDESSVEGGEVG